MDRGRSVLFRAHPPHLVDRWTGELARSLRYRGVAVTEFRRPAGARPWRRPCCPSVTVTSALASRPRSAGRLAKPQDDGGRRGPRLRHTHQGPAALQSAVALAKDPNANPDADSHATAETEAFARRCADPSDFARRVRRRAFTIGSRHFVQRRYRLTSGEWAEGAFPANKASDPPTVCPSRIDFRSAQLLLRVVACAGGVSAQRQPLGALP